MNRNRIVGEPTTPKLYFNIPRVLNRREMLKMAALAGCGLTIGYPLPAATNQTSETSAPKPLEPLNRFPRMVQEYFVERLGEFEIANRPRQGRPQDQGRR